ncbi:hypothetical protein JXJ21_07140 [candidate division KSB1 bacterium]|nr:hypothetical protein [candidate division KSB1 bacterium]
MQKFINLILLFTGALFLACSRGEIPTAVPPLVELQAKYITSRPVIDGRANDEVWKDANPYYVHVGKRDVLTGEIIEGYNLTLKAVWWREWHLTSAWTEIPYVAIMASWPDDDKNIKKNMWHYNPVDSLWTRDSEGSDWLLLRWYSTSTFIDLWYWDAALTNPMGYAEDQEVETFAVDDTTELLTFNIDGLSFLNDNEANVNTWDYNYDDNLTPRDSTDDFPSMIWGQNPGLETPSLPRIFSSTDETSSFLLSRDAVAMLSPNVAPFGTLNEPIDVPGYVLEEPKNDPADITAAGRYENGEWTLELMRISATGEDGDIQFSTDSRYSRWPCFIYIGDNSHIPFERRVSRETERMIFEAENIVILTFEFVK